ncbi:hypothetical protein K503DRAFT_87721 [Rhizopogon vinicolor AM-OR11-026]|uniref:Uncharacterized protein n=1 Tax=Rhizopogon vinicolor AM-OR11-026 TaxID=1314800 RepID=A0A1B7NFN0_9AGAM|nr:hypothetical protein K503DRAFT_87721 [Rhizopogon vinicolor AM-OR11-026]
MSTSWRSPLPAPHTTPVTTHPKSLRRPIHNPYDKFTKPEFDDWISGITGALRRALGEETEEDVVLDEHQSEDVYAIADETFQDQSFEDSFADIQSRRAKGKAKDPREGPGLGAQQNPIELPSDSGSGSEVESDEYDDESVQGEEGYRDYAEREEESLDVDAVPGVYNTHDQAGRWTLNGRHGPVVPEVEKDAVEEISSREESPDIIEIGSDREEDGRASVHGAGYSAAQYDRSPQLPPEEVEDELGSDDVAVNEEESQLDAEVKDFPPSTQRQPSPPLDLPDPWQGSRIYAEDFYAGGDFSVQDMLNGVSPSSLTPVHDTHADTYFSHKVQDDDSPKRASKTEPSVVNVDVIDDALPDSSPPPSSPIEERSGHHHADDYQLSSVRSTRQEPDDILDHLYRDVVQMSQDEQQMILNSSFGEFHSSTMSTSQAHTQSIEHLDWNWPPAFTQGKFASRAGHLESSPSRAGSDDVEEVHNGDIIDVDAELNEEEDGSDDFSEGPIPLGTSDLVYDDDVLQRGQDEHSNDRDRADEELVEGDDIRAPDDSRFPLPAELHLNADDRAAMESFFHLLNSREVSPLNVIEHVDVAGISSIATDPIGGDVTHSQSIEEAGDKYLLAIPSEELESVGGESRAAYPAESASIERIKTHAAEIQDQLQTIASEDVDELSLPFVAPTSALDDIPVLTEEQPDMPSTEPICIVVEMEVTAPVSRGVSEGIEVASFHGEVPGLDGGYVVQEPPTMEASVEPEDESGIAVDVLTEIVPVTPKSAPAELSSSDNHNASPFPMPIFGDPSALDPIISETKHPQQTPPRLVNLPGTPRIILSPHPTPGQPTPVSVSVSTSMLHAFSRRVSPFEGSSGPSGLFTPMEGELTSVGTGDAVGTPSPPRAGVPPLSAGDVLASVTTALAEERRAEINTPMIDVSENVSVGISTGGYPDGTSELAEDAQFVVSHPSSAEADNENDQPPSTKPGTGHCSVEQDSMVTSPKSERVQQARL